MGLLHRAGRDPGCRNLGNVFSGAASRPHPAHERAPPGITPQSKLLRCRLKKRKPQERTSALVGEASAAGRSFPGSSRIAYPASADMIDPVMVRKSDAA